MIAEVPAAAKHEGILIAVMPGLVPDIHVFCAAVDVDGRDKPGAMTV